ncbi:MAG: Rrf2 family transcriptional regulator [Clostridia bacterium]|nr:Rrf2 family transcriptional regulator [Clostridia bacterium]
MMITTKGKYALQTLLDIAEHTADDRQKVISLKAIAERQNFSLKYLESIVAMLNRGGLVQSIRGKEGGYRLARDPGEITVLEVMRATEGSLSPVSCLDNCPQEGCCSQEGCRTRPMWEKLDSMIDAYLSRISLSALLEGRID